MRYQIIIRLLTKPYLLQGLLADIGTALVLKIVEFLPDPLTREKEDRRRENPDDWSTSLSPSPRFQAWEYQKILKQGVLPLTEREPFTIARILIDATASMIRLRTHREQQEKVEGEDLSEIWCPRLDRPALQSGNSEVALVNTLTAACNAVYASATESVDALDQVLRNHRWHVFKRLRQHLYAQHPSDQTFPWIREFIVIHQDYDESDYHHEFQMMLRMACEHFGGRLLTEAERSTIFDAILSGPSQQSFREWIGDRFTEDMWNKRRRYFHRKQFHPFANVLFGGYRSYYEELEAEFADEQLTDEAYSMVGDVRSGTVSYQSPKSQEELVQLRDGELLEFINNWEQPRRDPEDWLVEINIHALARSFQSIFKNTITPDSARLTFWMNNCERVERPIYVKAMIAAMIELTKEKHFEHLELWLRFCGWVLERPNDMREDNERGSDESKEYPEWRSCRREVGDFVGTCLEKDVQAPVSARDALADLLRKLCTQFDYRLDLKRPVILNRESHVTEAVNNTRSRALENVVNFGYWLRRHNTVADLVEVTEILTARLALSVALPLTLPENAILGLHFVQIWDLNSEWAAANKNQLFPRDKLDVWAEAFRAFIRFSHPFLPIFELLKEDFMFALGHLDILDKDNKDNRDITDALGQHLFAYFLWDVYPLRGENSLLDDFYDRTYDNRASWAHLFDHVGRTLRNTPPKLNEKLHERVLAFFDWRVQEADPSELQEFTFWLEAACLDAEWRLDAFLKILGITTAEDTALSIELDTLNDLLENHPAKVVKCFAKITDALPSDRVMYFQTDKAKPILLAGLNSADDKVRSDAERARENLLKAGRYEFLELEPN